MDFQYANKDSFLGIKFNYTPTQVKAILGEPESVEKNYFSETNKQEFDETFYYENRQLRIIFYYDNSVVVELSIYTKNMLVNEVDIFSLSKSKVLSVIASMSCFSSQEAYKETVKLNNIDSNEYEFKDIGLTLWFEGDSLDEVCLFNTVESGVSQ